MIQLSRAFIGGSTLDRAIGDVYLEFKRLGIEHVIDNTEVKHTWFGIYYGYYAPDVAGKPGHVEIPSCSLLRLLCTAVGYQPLSVRQILRHEYGHALAYQYRRLMRSRLFSNAFELHHEKEQASEYDEEKHVTVYAATRPYEDFAEVFAEYVKYQGDIPAYYATPAIRRKWDFVRRLCSQVKYYRKTW